MTTTNISFKGYIPVKCYARNEGEQGNFRRVSDEGYLRGCQNVIVRNLNNTSPKEKNEDFVDFYKSHDKDYRALTHVNSVFSSEEPVFYLVSGRDTNAVYYEKQRIANAYKYGPRTVYKAKENYFKNIFKFMSDECKRLRTEDGDELTLKVFFEAKRNKKGVHKGEVNGFKIVNAQFERQEGG